MTLPTLFNVISCFTHQTLTECLLCDRDCGGQQYPHTVRHAVQEGKRGTCVLDGVGRTAILNRVVKEGFLIGCHVSRNLKGGQGRMAVYKTSISGTRKERRW